MTEFGSAIFNGSHTYGEIIGPVKSQYGYHVIFWEAQHAPAATRIDDLANQLKQHQAGVTFQSLAIADSDAPDASQGGDMGWIAKGQSADYRTEQALFGLQPGGVSSPVQLSDGYYLYSVGAIAQRTAVRGPGRVDPRQRLHRLVPAAEGRRGGQPHDHHRPVDDERDPVGPGQPVDRAMRPDLLATIERRHHIRVSDGLQVAGPSALAARPIDPALAPAGAAVRRGGRPGGAGGPRRG